MSKSWFRKMLALEEDEETDPTPAFEEPALGGTSAIAQPTPQKRPFLHTNLLLNP